MEDFLEELAVLQETAIVINNIYQIIGRIKVKIGFQAVNYSEVLPIDTFETAGGVQQCHLCLDSREFNLICSHSDRISLLLDVCSTSTLVSAQYTCTTL